MIYSVWKRSTRTGKEACKAKGKTVNGKRFTDEDRRMFAHMEKTGASSYAKGFGSDNEIEWRIDHA